MKTRYTIFSWLWGILITALLTSIFVPTMSDLTIFILKLMVLCAIETTATEIYFRIKESHYIKFERDIDPRKIKVLNDGYTIAEECFAKINKLYALGRNKTCEKIVDGNWDYILEWDDGSKNVEIPNGNHDLIDVFDASNDGIVLLFQDMKLPIPKYKDLKNGKDARKGKYQIEIEFHGNGKTQGGIDSLNKRSYWEIDYQSNNRIGKNPNFKMAKIKNMMKPTGKIDDEEFPDGGVFDLLISSNFKKG